MVSDVSARDEASAAVSCASSMTSAPVAVARKDGVRAGQ
jgi:hypothetical protein